MSFFPFFEYKEIDSTNVEAERLIEKGFLSGAVISDIQTSGRGRNGKSWSSENSQNLYLTIFGELPVNFKSEPSIISQISALAVKKSASYFVKNAKIQIKWPNDLLIDMRKCAGVLGKLKQFNEKLFFISGIGLNLVKPEKSETFSWLPASLDEFSAKKIEKKSLASFILQNFSYLLGMNIFQINSLFIEEIAWMKNLEIEYSEDSEIWKKGIIEGFASNGAVIIIRDNCDKKFLTTISIRKIFFNN